MTVRDPIQLSSHWELRREARAGYGAFGGIILYIVKGHGI